MKTFVNNHYHLIELITDDSNIKDWYSDDKVMLCKTFF